MAIDLLNIFTSSTLDPPLQNFCNWLSNTPVSVWI